MHPENGGPNPPYSSAFFYGLKWGRLVERTPLAATMSFGDVDGEHGSFFRTRWFYQPGAQATGANQPEVFTDPSLTVGASKDRPPERRPHISDLRLRTTDNGTRTLIPPLNYLYNPPIPSGVLFSIFTFTFNKLLRITI